LFFTDISRNRLSALAPDLLKNNYKSRTKVPMKIFESTKIPLLNKALSAYSLQQKITSANIANINTVGYRAKAVAFQSEMDSAAHLQAQELATTNAQHLSGTAADLNRTNGQIVDAASSGYIADDPHASGVNNVDIDYEMTELAQTQLRFKYAARLLAETFRGIQKSIRGTV
jgi:flagellar basal-body rod protein FlgB